MKVPAALVVALVSVLAGSLVLASSLANSNIFQGITRTSSQVQEAEAAILPLNIDEKFKSKEMAGDNSLKVIDEFIDPEHHCEFCTRVEYVPGPTGLAGFAYKDVNGLDFTGAKKVRFWVMGQDGGEKIKFDIAGKSLDKIQNKVTSKLVKGVFKNERFELSTQEIKLDKDWKKYEVDLTGADLRGITHPFGFELSKGSTDKKQIVYIKGLVYDTQPAENPIATIKVDAAAPLAAGIIANATEGVAPSTVEFKANVSGGTEPYDIAWNFDDGSKGDSQNAIHTFEKSGEYNVTLAVTDSGGQNASDDLTIQVAEPAAPEPEAGGAPVANTTEGRENNTNSTNETGGQDPGTAETGQDVKPEADAGVDIVAQPGDKVVLGGKVSGVEGNELSYSWTQTSGPKVEISESDSLNPTVTVPDDIVKDAKANLQLVASHASAQDEDSMTLFIDYAKKTKNAKDQSLEPSDAQVAGLDNEKCNNLPDCMSDNSDSTFATVSSDDSSEANLFSFKKFDGDNIKIQSVTAVPTAKKTGETGYLSIVWSDSDDSSHFTKATRAISITSDSFDKYEYVWKKNPVTKQAWTLDSLDSFLAGYAFADGDSVQVSEFDLVVTYTAIKAPAAVEPEVLPSENSTNSTATESD